MEKQKTALISGVTGQDGSHLSDLLLSKNYRVVGIARRASTDNTERIKHVLSNPNFELIEGDITDYVSVDNIVNRYKPDEYYNLAAMSHVHTSFEQPLYTLKVDAEAVLIALEVVRKRSPKTRFYQAGTSEQFGKNFDLVDGKKIQNENTPFDSRSPYSTAKIAAFHNVRLYRDAYGLFVCSGILMNHEGERRQETFVTRKITKWIGRFVNWMKKNKNTTFVYQGDENDNLLYQWNGNNIGFPKLKLGNIYAYRDWGYAKDYVEAMWTMLQQEKPDDFIIATGEAHSIEEFLIEAFDIANLGDYKKYVSIDQSLIRPAEVDYLCGDASKAKRILGWEPRVKFKELVKIMVLNDIKEAEKT